MLAKLNNCLNKQGTKVIIDWRNGQGDLPIWNEICAWVLEQYGLPGNKYHWHPKTDYMEFNFYDEKDAIHFILRWS
jgi:hypothetical protein